MQKNYKDYFSIIFLVAIAFCLYGLPALYAPDETRYAEVARNMLATHNYVVPYINGIVFFHKPALIYWLTAFFMNIFGENTWGARLVNPILIMICLLFVYYTVKKVLESRILAWLSVIVSITTVLLLFVGRYLNIDTGIAVFLNMTMLCYWVSLKYDDNYFKSSLWLFLAFVFSGIAFMTKGLVAIVFPICIVGLYSLIMLEWKRLLDIRLYLGLIIVAIIGTPWILAVNNKYPDFAYYYIVVQQILRYSTNEQNRQISKLVYLLIFIGIFFPWSAFLPQALKDFFTKEGFKNRKQNSFLWFLFIWGSFIFIFFGISKSFLIGYLAPAIVPFCILIAVYLEKLFKKDFSLMDKISIGLPIFVFLLLPIATVIVLYFSKEFLIPLFFLLLPIFIISIFVSYGTIRAFKRKDFKKIIIYFSLMMFTLGNFGYAAGEYLDKKNNKEFTDDINLIYKEYPNAKVYTSHRFYKVPFYTKKEVVIINDENELSDVAYIANSGTDQYLMKYSKFIKNWNRSDELNILIVKNKPNLKLKKDYVFSNYEKDINPDKFFILDKTDYATLVASKDISL